ncbi:hypothetical protein GUJ93_ZPchr0004g38947 [Zizania palustris]|uniref:Uncharacterized protein n=1 Tax=Zizania palustris TaxID=103762 RepID=A0A8J5V9B6_ZIZPA|nr:hypothetical protein GUJ93_ZPchr0004g38947 [Zizania palustris]
MAARGGGSGDIGVYFERRLKKAMDKLYRFPKPRPNPNSKPPSTSSALSMGRARKASGSGRTFTMGKLRLVRMLVYDPHLPWAQHVAHARGVQTTDFFAQPCTVDVFYRDVLVGRVGLPAINGTRSVGS